MLETLTKQAQQAVLELIKAADLQPYDLLVIGCSSSEVIGEKIGTHSAADAAKALLDGILPVLKEHHIYLAAQCCEHLNRALIIEKEAMSRFGYEQVCVVPWAHAGGAFATAVFQAMEQPVAVEEIKADAGMDIGDTLIGMHLKRVAVPVRLSLKKIGEANLVCAKTRPKFIGGERAHYNTSEALQQR